MNEQLDKRIIDGEQPELVVKEGDKNTAFLPRFVLVPAQGTSSGLKKKEEDHG